MYRGDRFHRPFRGFTTTRRYYEPQTHEGYSKHRYTVDHRRWSPVSEEKYGFKHEKQAFRSTQSGRFFHKAKRQRHSRWEPRSRSRSGSPSRSPSPRRSRDKQNSIWSSRELSHSYKPKDYDKEVPEREATDTEDMDNVDLPDFEEYGERHKKSWHNGSRGRHTHHNKHERRGRRYENVDLRELIKGREEQKSPRFDSSRDRYSDIFDESDFEKNNEEEHDDSEHWKEQPDRTERTPSSSSIKVTLQRHGKIVTQHSSQHSDDDTDPGIFSSSKDEQTELPVFDGIDPDLTPRQFVKIIDKLGDKYGWQSDDRKCQMAGKLQGAPKEWLLKDDLMNESWEKIKSQFIKVHPTDMDYYHLLKKMLDRNMHDHESFSNYFTFKTMLMNAVGISGGRRAVSCLIGGLRSQSLQNECYNENFPTPDALYNYLTSRTPSENSRSRSHSKGEGKSLRGESGISDLPPREVDRTTNSMVRTNYDSKHLISVKINSNTLDAYNDMLAVSLTMKEETAKSLRLEFRERRTTVIGFRGVPVMALGDCKSRFAVDQVTVNAKIFIVPNVSQEMPVVIGQNFRDYEQIKYTEHQNSISFQSRE